MVGRGLVVVASNVVVVAFRVVVAVAFSVVTCGLLVGCKVFRRFSSSFINSSNFLLSSLAFCCSLVISLGRLVVDISFIVSSVVLREAESGVMIFFTVLGG